MIKVHSLGRAATLFAIVVALGANFAQAQQRLSDSARKEAKQWLEEVKEGYLSGTSSRLQKAVSALTRAASSERDAMELYMKAMESRYMNQSKSMRSMMARSRGFSGGGPGGNRGGMGGPGGNRGGMGGPGGSRGGMGGSSSGKADSPAAQFSNWRKQFKDNLTPAFKKALQMQCKWALLSLRKADAEKHERELDVSSEVLAMINELAANAKTLADQMNAVSGASSTIRDYLGLNDYRSESIPDNMMDFNSIFEQVLLPPYQLNKDVEGFRSMWNKRIQMELLMMSTNSTSDKKTLEEEKKLFYDGRKWEMEKACFELGAQVAALENLTTLLQSKKDPAERQSAIKELEFLLMTPEQQKEKKTKDREEREARMERMFRNGPPRF